MNGDARSCARGGCCGENEDSAAVREAWRQNIRLIRTPSDENPVATSMEQLEQAALAIGVIIQKCGAFPKPES